MVSGRCRRLRLGSAALLLLMGGFAWYWHATAVDRQADALFAEARKQGPTWIESWLIEIGLMQSRPTDREPYALAHDTVRLGPSVVPKLVRAVRDRHPRVRHLAVSALGDLGDLRGVEPLIAALEDEDHSVRVAAVTGLGNLGDRRAVEALIAVLKDKEAPVRSCAALALGELGDVRAVQPLIAALKDEDGVVRFIAAWALGELQDARAMGPLEGLLGDEEARVRKAAAEALKQLRRHSEGKL